MMKADYWENMDHFQDCKTWHANSDPQTYVMNRWRTSDVIYV